VLLSGSRHPLTPPILPQSLMASQPTTARFTSRDAPRLHLDPKSLERPSHLSRCPLLCA
jgi:hypothetical protein